MLLLCFAHNVDFWPRACRMTAASLSKYFTTLKAPLYPFLRIRKTLPHSLFRIIDMPIPKSSPGKENGISMIGWDKLRLSSLGVGKGPAFSKVCSLPTTEQCQSFDLREDECVELLQSEWSTVSAMLSQEDPRRNGSQSRAGTFQVFALWKENTYWRITR